MTQPTTLIIFIVEFILAGIFTSGAIFLSKRIGFYDRPHAEDHKQHTKPTPLAGGLALFISIAITLIFFSDKWADLDLREPYFLLGILIIFLTGIFDDIYIFPPKYKFVGQIIGSLMLVFGGWSSSIFAFAPLNILISLAWYVGLINAFNFLDGSDGMILQTGAVITVATIIFAEMSDQTSLQIFSIALLGIQMGLLLFNFRPAKMFMGDSGSQVLGLLLALIVLNYNPVGYQKATSWITPILMMSLPIFDVTLVVISRLRRGVSISRASLDHTYHRLVQRGLKPPMATLTLLFVVVVSNSVAHLVLTADQITAYVIFGLVLFSGAGLIYWFEKDFQVKER